MAPISVELFHSGGMERILQHSQGPLCAGLFGIEASCMHYQYFEKDLVSIV